jgi:nitrite reductase/ring-hydroxylating ferredoxin subunit
VTDPDGATSGPPLPGREGGAAEPGLPQAPRVALTPPSLAVPGSAGAPFVALLQVGQFDLCSGETVRMPTTGGLDADGAPHLPWSPPGSAPKPEPAGLKAEARRLTRVRRLRHYPVRVVDGMIEIAIPLP